MPAPAGTDGLWDNCYLHDVASMVRSSFAAPEASASGHAARGLVPADETAAAAAAAAAAAVAGASLDAAGVRGDSIGTDGSFISEAGGARPTGDADVGSGAGGASGEEALSAAVGLDADAGDGSNDANSTRSCTSMCSVGRSSCSTSSLSSGAGECGAVGEEDAQGMGVPSAQSLAEALAAMARANSTDPQVKV